MDSTSNSGRALPRPSNHVDALLQEAPQQVNMTQQSQTPHHRGNHTHPSYPSQRPQPVHPSRGQGRAQARGEWQGQVRGQGHIGFRRPSKSTTSAAPRLSDSQAFPLLGSVPPHPRSQNAPSPVHPGLGSAPAQNLTTTTSPPTFRYHTNTNAPQEFFQRARASIYRGNPTQVRQQGIHYHAGNQATALSSGPNLALNTYSRPRPRNHNLYEPSSIPNQQHIQGTVRLQHQFLMRAASVALQTALSPAEGQVKDAFRIELENVAQAAVAEYAKSDLAPVDPKKVTLKCYGSMASGFALEGSDLDLLLMISQGNGTAGSIEADVQRWLEKAFLDAGYGARLLTNTRVPILRVCQKPTSELLENLRQTRRKWEVEEEQAVNEKANNLRGLDSSRLPETTDEQQRAASKAFAELELSATNVPLPPSPVREHASLEYKGDVGIHCDINFSNYVAIHNTTLLRCYCKCDPRVREIGLFVKAWAKARKINTPYYGTLSSYGYILMVLHYLMNVAKPPVIPNLQQTARDSDAWAGKTEVELFEGFDIRFDNNELKIENAARTGQMTQNTQSLGALLHGFFWYYSDRQGFRWIDEVISIRTVGGILTKQSKGWTEGKWAGEKNQVRLRYLFAIEDPFETEHNIARTVGHSGVMAIRDEFRRARDIIIKVGLTYGGEGSWQKADGKIGEDLLEQAEDRGDLLKKDQEYHRKKQQDVRAASEANKARARPVKAEGRAIDDLDSRSGNIVESGMSPASTHNPTQANKAVLSTDRSSSQLIRNSKPQLAPKCKKGRWRKARTNNDGLEDEVDQTPKFSLESCGALSSSIAETTSVHECETDLKSLKELGEVSGRTADSYCPYIDPELLNASVPLRLEDVSISPGPLNDGKLLAWNTDNQVGRWLQWRDQKIRRGYFDPQKHSVGLFNTVHRLFPYNSSRPVSSPSRIQLERNNHLREKRIAYFTRSSAVPEKNADPNTTDCGSNYPSQFLHVSDEHSFIGLESPRKKSDISGVTSPCPGWNSAPIPEICKCRNNGGSGKQPVISASEAPTINPGKTKSVATVESVSAPAQHGVDMSLRFRKEDTRIMPIPPSMDFKFDPRQLRDIEIIRKGGNGCARSGEEWNVEIEGEWGGGGIMGAVNTSSGLITTPIGTSGGNGGGGECEYGRDDGEGFLCELPGFEAIKV